MCGRYSLVCIDDLGNRFHIFNPMFGARSMFNIAPGTRPPVIVQGASDREIVQMQRGLILRGTTVTRDSHPVINIREEFLEEKPLFAPLLKTRCCLVPASGFFEGRRRGGADASFY